jgi:hypothetical protein
MNRRPLLIAVSLLSLTCVGCQTMWGNSWSEGSALRSGGRENPADSDPWVKEAGTYARTEHPPEEVHDPLNLRKYLSSEKARQIERNVGVGD